MANFGVTLTIRPKRATMSPKNLFVRTVQLIAAKLFDITKRWTLVPELTKTGYIHYHVDVTLKYESIQFGWPSFVSWWNRNYGFLCITHYNAQEALCLDSLRGDHYELPRTQFNRLRWLVYMQKGDLLRHYFPAFKMRVVGSETFSQLLGLIKKRERRHALMREEIRFRNRNPFERFDPELPMTTL